MEILNIIGRKLSPTNQRLTPKSANEKTDISDEEDPTVLKLQLELSEQEASVLRKKVEELETDNEKLTAQRKELQEKCNNNKTVKPTILSNDKGNTLESKKLKVYYLYAQTIKNSNLNISLDFRG